MWGVKGVRFTACTFDNDFIALEKQQNTNGIYSIDARFKVDWKCTAMNLQTAAQARTAVTSKECIAV